MQDGVRGSPYEGETGSMPIAPSGVGSSTGVGAREGFGQRSRE
jgi:hypothetical protein